MMGALLLAACGALEFAAQELDILRVEDADPLVGAVALNALRSDIDGDGASDLLFREGVVFIRDGRYAAEDLVPLPGEAAGRDCEPYGGSLYCLGPERLYVFAWQGDWELTLEQDIDGPARLEEAGPESGPAAPRSARLGRFLHDLDGGAPEIVVADAEGLRVLARGEDGRYAQRAEVHVYPRLALAPMGPRVLWPEDARRRRWPAEQSQSRLVLEDGRLLTLTNEATGRRRHRYRWTRTLLALEEEPPAQQASAGSTGALPFYVQPCRLNADDALDFAGSHWELSEAAAVPAPVRETRISTDGGQTFQVFRHRAFAQPVLFADADGDGDLDLLAAETLLFHGGPRETLTRLLTARRVATQVRLYRQGAGGRFATRPAARHVFHTELRDSFLRDPEAARRYQQGLHLHFGDFDGDGRADALLRAAPERFEARLTKRPGAWGAPAARIKSAPGAEAHVVDLDLDGRDDVIISRYDPERPWLSASTAYLSREGRR